MPVREVNYTDILTILVMHYPSLSEEVRAVRPARGSTTNTDYSGGFRFIYVTVLTPSPHHD